MDIDLAQFCTTITTDADKSIYLYVQHRPHPQLYYHLFKYWHLHSARVQQVLIWRGDSGRDPEGEMLASD